MVIVPEKSMSLDYVMRVKLPSSASFHSSPSGDTEYEGAYRKAINDGLPPGFEVAWSTKQLWPMDRDGFTWVKLYCRDEGAGMNYWMNESHRLRKEVDRIKSLASQITK